ncbi:uncharacterized protein LOC143571741 [Bidens hawaiensis]|uniref:uncharacterized protein LOC143571741 n=1 Tax=Bidens hawaiensis TaxID=980011 RepID=UPI004049490D
MVILNSYVAPDYNFEWNRLVPKKVSFVAWRALLGRLPTFDALVRRNIALASNMCPFCGEVEETVEHVFISCGLAQSMWSVLAQWCKVPSFFCLAFVTCWETINTRRLRRINPQCFMRCVWLRRSVCGKKEMLWFIEGPDSDIKLGGGDKSVGISLD